jgi:hypothetical protein
VEILRREHHLTTQEAIARSVDLCDRLTHRFARLRDQVMPRASGPLRAYLGHLTHLTPGNLDWGLRADRYRNPDGRHPDAVTTSASTTRTPPVDTSPPPIPSIPWWWDTDLA